MIVDSQTHFELESDLAMYHPWSRDILPLKFVTGSNPVDDDDGEIDLRKPSNKISSNLRKPSNKLSSEHLFRKPSNIISIEQLNSMYNGNFFLPSYMREWGGPPSRDTTRVNRRMHRTQDLENLQSHVVGNPEKIPEILALVESIENNQEFKDVENLQSFVIGNPKKIPEKLALIESSENRQEFKDVENLQSLIVGNPKKIPEKLEKFLKDFAEAHSGARKINMKNKKMKSQTTEKNEGVKECDDVSISSASEKDQDIEQTIDKLARLNSFEEETYSLTEMDSGEKFQTVVSKKKKQPPKTDSRSFDSRNITHANQNIARSNPVQNSLKPHQPSMRNKKNETAVTKNTISNSDES